MNQEQVRGALAFVPPTDRDVWLRMAMAIKSELGDEGFDLWDEWSQADESYRSLDSRNVWRSIRPDGAITGATLFYEAKQRGWRDTASNGNGHSSGHTLPDLDRAARERARQQSEAETLQRRQAAQKRALEIWDAALPAPESHEYLQRKKVKPHSLRVYRGDLTIAGMRCDGALIAPIRDASSMLQTMEFIGPDGTKRYLPDGLKAGGYFALGKPADTIVVAEGFATGASVYESTGHAVAIALDAGNLSAVAKTMRAKFPQARIILAGDNDANGRGQRDARAAALAVGGCIAIPAQAGIDWNDVMLSGGMEAVRLGIDGAQLLGNGHVSQESQVSQPVPLIRPIAPAAPYPIDALGAILAPAARAVMEYVQVPDALAAHAVLGCAALAAQPHANVQTLGGARPLSLFMLTIAESGERKSAADNLANTPVHEHRKMLQTAYKAALREYEAAHEGHRMRVRKAKEDAPNADDLTTALKEIQEEPPPRKPFFIVSEPTAEGLVISLRDGQLSQALSTDEGGQFLGGHAMSEESELRTITLLSRLWDGSPIDRVRATEKEHTTLFGRRLAVHLMAQPEVANRMLGKSLYRSQGMLARFLICAPNSRIGTRVHDGHTADPRDDSRLRKYWHAVRQLLETQPHEDREMGGLDPPCLALSPEARALLVAAHNDIEAAMKDDGELVTVREFASKAAEHACRIAGVLTLITDPAAMSITVETMRSALELAQAYIREHIRLAGSASVSVDVGNAVKLQEWLKRTKRREVTARNVMQLGPYAIREAPAAKAALRMLLDHGWLLTEDGSRYTVPLHVAEEWGG